MVGTGLNVGIGVRVGVCEGAAVGIGVGAPWEGVSEELGEGFLRVAVSYSDFSLSTALRVGA